jgi:quercetin dioxygenase-like cupin family protein
VTAPVLLCPGGRLPADLAGSWGAAAFAELTHAPTGFSGLGSEVVALANGHTGPWQCYAGHGALLVVLAGHLAVEPGPGAAAVVAGAGDTLAIAAGAVHRERHGGGADPVRFTRLAPGGPAVPAPAPPG